MEIPDDFRARANRESFDATLPAWANKRPDCIYAGWIGRREYPGQSSFETLVERARSDGHIVDVYPQGAVEWIPRSLRRLKWTTKTACV